MQIVQHCEQVKLVRCKCILTGPVKSCLFRVAHGHTIYCANSTMDIVRLYPDCVLNLTLNKEETILHENMFNLLHLVINKEMQTAVFIRTTHPYRVCWHCILTQ